MTIYVTHSIASLHPDSGGPARTVTSLTDAIAQSKNIKVSLLSQSYLGVSTIPSSNPSVIRHVHESSSKLNFKLGLSIRKSLRSEQIKNNTSIMHDHGLWLPSNHWVASFASANRIPLIIQPRGMLEPWAINNKALKKKLSLLLYQWRDIKTARVLIATAMSEYENMRELGIRQPIAIIPNGVHLPKCTTDELAHQKGREKKRTALFLSRIHQKKGLINLIDAWAKIRPDGWRLAIAGPDEGGHLAEVFARAVQMGVSDTVEYLGVVDGDEKSKTYRAADLFVLPTFSENFGVVVAEALAHGLPVITTTGAPWNDLEIFNCGWWIDIGVEPLAQALRKATSLSDDERHVMGSRGRKYVQRYNWNDIAEKTIEVYRWILDLGDKPTTVHTY